MYKISGADKSIVWQLGGQNSSFVLDGFNFSRQHDARWLSYNESTEIISFLDNAGDPESQSADTSSALVVALDKAAEPPTARVVSRIWRPDGGRSLIRGNYQTFKDSSNTFVGWSENSYMSEHDESGRLLMEARFRSERFVTYRAYKYNFTGTPVDEPPALKSYAFGTSRDTALLVAFVSWNGATEVSSWNFYANATAPVFLGSTPKTGFETSFQVQGYYGSIFAEAVTKENVVLGRSQVEVVLQPSHWDEDLDIEGLYPVYPIELGSKEEL